MEKIKEVIVVEGKNDTALLKRCFDCDTVETGGSAIDKVTLELIAALQQSRGVIILTDPDYPGEKIRNTINKAVPGCKNAFVPREKAHTTRKVGVEHASPETIKEALANLLTYSEKQESLSREAFLELGLNGSPEAAGRRKKLAEAFHFGPCNARTCYARLNMLEKTKEDCLKVLEERDV